MDSNFDTFGVPFNPFLIILGSTVGFVASCGIWDLLNIPSKKKLLGLYDEVGVTVPARLLKQTVTSHTTNFIQTRMTLGIQYEYLMMGHQGSAAAGKIYTREHTETSHGCGGASFETFPNLFLVQVLPNYPKSGIPKRRVENCDAEFGQGAIIKRVLLCLLLAFFGSVWFVAAFDNAGEIANWLMPTAILIMLLSAAPCRNCMFNSWKKALLEKVVEERVRNGPIPAPVAVGRRQGDRGIRYEPVPLVEATAVHDSVNNNHVDHQGPNIAFATAIDHNAGGGPGDDVEMGPIANIVTNDPGIPPHKQVV